MPRFPLVPPTSHSPNVNPRRARYYTPLLWLCGFPGKLPGMHQHNVQLGMRPQHLSFDLMLATDGVVCQTFNSLSQNPCEVYAYLLSTCWQGCRCSPCVYQHGILTSGSVHSPSPLARGGIHRPDCEGPEPDRLVVRLQYCCLFCPMRMCCMPGLYLDLV